MFVEKDSLEKDVNGVSTVLSPNFADVKEVKKTIIRVHIHRFNL